MYAKLTLNLTKIGQLMRENPTMVFNRKNGDKTITVAVSTRKNGPDQFGNDLNVAFKPKDAPHDNKYYVGDGKEYKDNFNTAPQNNNLAQALAQDTQSSDSLPF